MSCISRYNLVDLGGVLLILIAILLILVAVSYGLSFSMMLT